MIYTNNKINIKKLEYIPLIFLFLPAFCIPFGSKPILAFFVVNVILFSIFVIFKPLILIKHIVYLYKKTSFKYFIIWSIWILLSGMILVIFGKYHIAHYIYYMILYLLINMMLTLLLPTILIKNENNLNFIIRFTVISVYIILIIGIINFIGLKFDITIIEHFFKIIVNQRVIATQGNFSQYNKVFSVFAEPGWFGGFIALFLPVTFSISRSKYKLLKNNVLNLFIKRTIVPLSLINVLLTFSPIWLIFVSLIYLFLILGRAKIIIRKNILKFLLLIIIITGSIFYLFGKIDDIVENENNNQNKYIVRIVNTVQAIKKADYLFFVMTEPSLASRITSYLNSLRLFVDYPVTGVGIGNSKFFMANKFETSPFPLTDENQMNLQRSEQKGQLNFNSAFLYELLSETGIIGFLLYYYFLYRVFRQLKKRKKYYYGINLDFINGLIKTFPLLFFVFSMYDVGLMNIHIWFILGTSIAIINLKKFSYIRELTLKEPLSDNNISSNTNI